MHQRIINVIWFLFAPGVLPLCPEIAFQDGSRCDGPGRALVERRFRDKRVADMIPYLVLQVLSEDEITRIHQAMVVILSRTGLAVENDQLCEALAGYGAHVQRQMLQRWLAGDRKIDSDRAYDLWQDLMALPDSEPGISRETEVRLERVVEHAVRFL